MKRRLSVRGTEIAIAVAAAATCFSLAVLVGFSYRAVSEWRRSEELLAERRARDTADRLVAVLVSDMRGAQNAILAPGWEDLPVDPPADSSRLVGSAFARYPYPESFFAWRPAADRAPMVFFNRSDRPPPWMPARLGGDDPFPVSVARDPSAARVILDRITADARQGRRLSTFETALGGQRYQVVARLFYRDPFREALDRVVGFTVNMSWARRYYFPEMTRQVARMGEGLPLAIVDEGGGAIAGIPPRRGRQPIIRRPFPVVFFDPLQVGVDAAEDRTTLSWAVQVATGDDEALATATRGAHRTLLVASMAVGALAIGLLLTARAARDHARLAAMRSDLVSTVTHELKTPIATIRAIGDTLARGRVTEPGALREYAELVVQESRRLGRLVDNLLAYARITDLADVYTFAPLSARDLVDEVLKQFQTRLSVGGFEARVEVAPGVPPIRGDRTALRLALENLVDNAIRYSDKARRLDLRVLAPDGDCVAIEVTDRGVGIPAGEIPHVTRRFQRGSRTRSSGSGLGLAIVERIVKDHGGTLGIESRVGEGTTVRIVIPAAEAAHGEASPDR